MSEIYKETRTTRQHSDQDIVDDKPTNIIARVVYLVYGIISALLALRFVLMLLGANRGNAFTDFIFTVTQPLVAPFFGMFNYDPTYGTSRFELETLIAIAVYGLLAWVIVRLLTIGDRHAEV